MIKDFWQETGFVVNLESPETGVIETDWAENRANIPQDVIRRTLGKVLDGLYSTAERDKFRTRIEAGKDGGTEIYISHRGMVEVYDSANKDRTVWQPRPADPELEAEMLRRLMLRFGVEESRAETLLAKQADAGTGAHSSAKPVRRCWKWTRISTAPGAASAWRSTASALRWKTATAPRACISCAISIPSVDNASKRDEGMLAKLAFWRSKKDQTSPQLQIVVSEAGDKSRVSVSGAEGKPADATTQTRILNLLHKELK